MVENEENLLHLLEKLSLLQEKNVSGNPSLLIMSDFNYPEINFEHYEDSASVDSSPAKFFDKTQDMFLIQNVFQPTRMRENQAPSILDLVFTDEENLIDDIKYQAQIGLIDHVCLVWSLVMVKTDNNNEETKNYDEIA